MARLYDSARDKKAGAGYSLESLTADREIMGEKTNAKIGMATLFGRPNIKKDGAEGKLKVLPPIEELQTAPETREAFVQYAAYDATVSGEGGSAHLSGPFAAFEEDEPQQRSEERHVLFCQCGQFLHCFSCSPLRSTFAASRLV